MGHELVAAPHVELVSVVGMSGSAVGAAGDDQPEASRSTRSRTCRYTDRLVTPNPAPTVQP